MIELNAPPEDAPVPVSSPPAPKPAGSILTRPLIFGQSLPWLAGIVIVLAVAAWYFFWPSSSVPDTGQLAFGQPAGMRAVAPASSIPLQTGGLHVPGAAPSEGIAGGTVPEEVVKMIRDGRDFEAANREAISRLSDTVRAQSAALAALQKQSENQVAENATLANRLTVLEARAPAAPTSSVNTKHRSVRRPALAGMQLEGVQDGMAWVKWQGQTWAVQPGQQLGSLTVIEVNADNREVVTSGGVLR
ncbi:conjugal transfer protein TraP [Rahnella sp. BCC 1045]|uniref:conjugal transfer protein TraP n=1 Tax=Rahnella sp. BCC 1045 TaxID=2816251 RepID=UPI0020B78054|nr:conjugal transfer protein TraP [Rahnella sp. BCC 1045]